MIVNVKMMDDYNFILDMDDEAIELLHRIGKKRIVSAELIVNEIMLGGLALEEHLFLCPERAGLEIKRNRWDTLSNLLKKLIR